MLSKGPKKGPSWVHESPYLTIGWEDTKEFGAPSLKHSSMRQVLSDQSMLTPELFANVPWGLASYLWECLGRSKKRTTYMWKLLSTVYPDQFRQISRYSCMRIEGPRMPLREYLTLLKSDSLHWGVALTLFTSFASIAELVEVASVKNLVALELNTSSGLETVSHSTEGPMTTLNDRIMRTWSELAETPSSAGADGSAFAHLRVLKIVHQTQVSTSTLRYLRSFPSLRTLLVCDCPSIACAFEKSRFRAVEGWHPTVSGEYQPVSHPDQLYGYYEQSFAAHIDSSDEAPSMRQDTPILGFQVGREMRPLSKKRFNMIHLVRQDGPAQQEDREPATKRPRQIFKQSQLDPAKPSRSIKERKGLDLDTVLNDLL